MLDKDFDMKIDRDEPGGLDETPEAKSIAADSAAADAEVAKLAADLQDLRQTLLRRQADFDNYRKRIERERAEDSKRYTARMIEALIPIIDGFEHALAAHREPAYENYRKGFELIYKQLLDNLAKSALAPGDGSHGNQRGRGRHHPAGVSARLRISRPRAAPGDGACSGTRDSGI